MENVNPDGSKQAPEVIFSRKKTISSHPVAFFNNVSIKREPCQKHLGLFLDKKLNFVEHIDGKFS